MPDLTLVLGPDWSRFSKRIQRTADGYDVSAADQLPKLLEFEDADIAGIQDLYEILNLLRAQQNTCVIRGQLIAGTEQPCRRLLVPRTEDGVHYPATFEDVPRSWMMVDFDSVDAPDGYDFAADPGRCAELMRAALPPAFHTAACVWRASGSAGFKPGIRLHLWFLLTRPLTGAECKAWTSHADVPCDRTVYGAVMPHFTADPELAESILDPMTDRIGRLEGTERVLVPDVIPADRLASASKTAKAHTIQARDDRELDPFLRSALRKWEAANPCDVTDLATRFECPACGSSDGCALLPDGKLFCHGNKHSQHAPNIGHAANNGYVMTRFEAEERLEWAQVVPRLQALGYYPGAPDTKRLHKQANVDVMEHTVDATLAADVMSSVVEGRALPTEVDLPKLRRAHKKLKEIASIVRSDPSQLEAVTYEYAREFVPAEISAGALRDALTEANSTSRTPGAALLDVDAVEAITRGIARAAAHPRTEQPSALARDMYGKPERCHANVVKLLNLPDFTDVLAWDVRARKKLVTAPPPWIIDDEDTRYPRPVLDTDYSAITVYLSDRLEYPHASPGQVAEALALACTARVFDPVLDYFDTLPPFEGDYDDARAVAGCWLTEFAGAPDDVYTRAVAMRWLIGAVARTYVPGSKNREVLTLLGPQNIGKSMMLATLCADPSWFKDDMNADKDAAQSLLGKLIVEIAELDKIVATDRHGVLKSFISTSVDDYRRPYGREFESVPRRSVFAASANVEQLFRDPTGNTRFNVVVLPGHVDCAGLAAVRDELWCAARMLFKAGEQWYLTADEQTAAVERQNAHREVSDAEVLLRDLVDRVFVVTTPPQFAHGGQFEKAERGKYLVWAETAQLMEYLREHGITRGVAKHVHECMKRIGWEYYRHVGANKNSGPRGFQRPSSTSETTDGRLADANKGK